MLSSSWRAASALLLGAVTGCILVLWAQGSTRAQTPEPKGKHLYSLQYIKLPPSNGEISALEGCKSVSIAAVTHGGEPQLAALCEK
jgi:hypothetical protein